MNQEPDAGRTVAVGQGEARVSCGTFFGDVPTADMAVLSLSVGSSVVDGVS